MQWISANPSRAARRSTRGCKAATAPPPHGEMADRRQADTRARAIGASGGAADSQTDGAQPQRIADDQNRAQAHRRAGDHRIEQQAEGRIEHAGRERHRERIEDKGEEQVLPDVAHGGAAEMPRAHDASQIAFDQGDAGAFHRDIGAGAHGDADLGLGERRRIIDAVTRHGDEAALILEFLDRRGLLIRQHLGHDVIDAELAPDRPAVVRLSPVSMTTRMPSARSALQRGDRALLDRIGDGDRPAALSSTAISMTPWPSCRSASALAGKILGIDAESCEQREIADRHALAVDGADHAFAGFRRKSVAGEMRGRALRRL